MDMIKKNKGVIIFYILVLVCTLMMIERVKELNKIDNISNNEIAYNAVFK